MYEKRGFCFPGFNIVVTEITVSPCGGMEKERKRGGNYQPRRKTGYFSANGAFFC